MSEASSQDEAERPAERPAEGSGDRFFPVPEELGRVGIGECEAEGREADAADLNKVWKMKDPHRTRKELRKRKHQLQRSVVLAELAASSSMDMAALPN